MSSPPSVKVHGQDADMGGPPEFRFFPLSEHAEEGGDRPWRMIMNECTIWMWLACVNCVIQLPILLDIVELQVSSIQYNYWSLSYKYCKFKTVYLLINWPKSENNNKTYSTYSNSFYCTHWRWYSKNLIAIAFTIPFCTIGESGKLRKKLEKLPQILGRKEIY